MSVHSNVIEHLNKRQFKSIIIAMLCIVLFFPALANLIQVWASNEDYSHGFIVMPISLFLAWQKRKSIIESVSSGNWSGLPVFIIGLCGYCIGYISRFHSLTYASMLIFLAGVVIFLSGWQTLKAVLVPVGFLVFMFPIPQSIYVQVTNPLKLFVAKISETVIYLLHIPVYREGNLLFFSNGQLEITEACSGLRSIYAFVMIGLLLAYISRSRESKIVILLSIVPTSIFANFLRVSSTGIFFHLYGSSAAEGFFHEIMGILVFVVGLAILFMIYRVSDQLLTYRCARHKEQNH